MELISVASDTNRCSILTESATMHDQKLILVTPDKWKHNTDKLIYIRQHLETLPDDAIICFVDAYDVIVCRDMTTVFDTFKKTGAELLVSTELNCFPAKHMSFMTAIYGAEEPYRFINSGCYIGYKRAIWPLVSNTSNYTNKASDQSYFYEEYVKNPSCMSLDTGCQLFQCMYSVNLDNFSMINGRVYNKVKNTYPAFLHFSGDSMKVRGIDLMKCIMQGKRDMFSCESLLELLLKHRQQIPFVRIIKKRNTPPIIPHVAATAVDGVADVAAADAADVAAADAADVAAADVADVAVPAVAVADAVPTVVPTVVPVVFPVPAPVPVVTSRFGDFVITKCHNRPSGPRHRYGHHS